MKPVDASPAWSSPRRMRAEWKMRKGWSKLVRAGQVAKIKLSRAVLDQRVPGRPGTPLVYNDFCSC